MRAKVETVPCSSYASLPTNGGRRRGDVDQDGAFQGGRALMQAARPAERYRAVEQREYAGSRARSRDTQFEYRATRTTEVV